MRDVDLNWRTHVSDLDLDSDEAWEPVYSAYHGEVVPAWCVTQVARFRMGYMPKPRPYPWER